MKVLISASVLHRLPGEFLDVLVGAGFEAVYPPVAKQVTEEELLSLLPGVSATLCGMEPYTRRVIERNPDLRVIARVGVGYDVVDEQAATEHGVAIVITPGANQESVAEHTFALMLALVKRIVPDHNGTIQGRWPRQITLPLRGKVLGIVGLGRIGKAVALRAEAFSMRLLAYEKFPDHAFIAQHGITLLPLEKLLAEADIVSVHAPSTPETKHLINKSTLAFMKPSAFLINTARGGLVCETDLVNSLQAGRIAGAGLDVLEKEPPDPDNPLFSLNNVVLTPHTAGVDMRSRDDMALSAAQGIVDLSQGQWPAEKIVNPQVRERFRW